MHNEHDDADHQQQVDRPATNMDHEGAQQPEN